MALRLWSSLNRKGERAPAFEGFVANTGRYELRGDTLILRPFVASRPYRMNGFPDHGWTLTYRVTGDTLRVRAPRGLVIVFRRVDGAGLKP